MIEVASFLRPSQKQALQHYCGITHLSSVVENGWFPCDIVSRCQGAITVDEAAYIVQQAHSQFASAPLSLLSTQVDVETKSNEKIPTFSAELDQMLSGGIGSGVTEVCGAPGTGKTQLCMQLTVSCFLPYSFGGHGELSSVLYIDTEGSFVASRLEEIAQAAVAQVTKIAHNERWHSELSPSQADELRSSADRFTVDHVLSQTKVARVVHLEDFLSLVHSLPHLIAATPSIRLVVIDSVAFPFRGGEMDGAAQSRMLFHLGQLLQEVSRMPNRPSIVVTNQMSTRVAASGEERTLELVPALGRAWAHTISTRLLLRAPAPNLVTVSSEHGATVTRVADLRKSPLGRTGQCTFSICRAGVRNASSQTDSVPEL